MRQEPVTVDQFYKANSAALGLQLLAGEGGLKNVIKEPTVNRPGLALAGFTKYFAKNRVQVIGAAEYTFLKSLPPEQRESRYRLVLSSKVPCMVYGRSLKADRILLGMAEQMNIPIFSCPLITMQFINMATLALENAFAPRGSEMGSMVDILGIGVIIKGESGIGKSECVLALIERGYSLVADDITRLVLLDGQEVVGSCAELTRNHMEVRGIGIINVAAMFGVKSIRDQKRVDLVVSLRSWNEVPDVDRLGLEDEHIELLGVKIPHITIPVRPGRDIARLVEVAAFQTKLKASGYNPARELNERLLAQMAAQK